MKLFLRHITDKICVKRSVKVALVVGTILGLINHYDTIFYGTLTATNIFQILLTYLVPYAVVTFGSAMQARHIELHGLQKLKGLGGKNRERFENEKIERFRLRLLRIASQFSTFSFRKGDLTLIRRN